MVLVDFNNPEKISNIFHSKLNINANNKYIHINNYEEMLDYDLVETEE